MFESIPLGRLVVSFRHETRDSVPADCRGDWVAFNLCSPQKPFE